MNKQEVIERLEEKKSSFNAWKNLVRNRALDDALDIVKQLDEPEKTVVPKFVAEWIKSHKESFSDASAIDMYDNLTLDNRNGYYHEVWLWVIAHHHDFIKAWHDGYEIEKEKLYTVEIPNPNEPDSGHIVLHKDEHNKVYIDWHYEDDWKLLKSLKLTEAEIKKDFEWAWQFAEEVEE
ncbi:hypothetical protein Si039_01178 [Streptococcus infantarius subsp. infantarius]|nr:hypothetical protein [Streptococcus infantarius subsp. infantarius]MCO4625414.1 hypothetical protein [Streptococcus infantarius subsp. infantarius]